ncbi:hypothetical protein [Telluribacter sp. SYSU D00476]|uniref:hypothetical protein n=1 Tax=Telluribacter sp. SYSU D00476 TaxID=2811430 RepID=UPI001FF15FD7|nr:hypothetical protein [Telluribacter sp. SYSU D00476]
MKNITQLFLCLTLAACMASCNTDPGAVDPDNPGDNPGKPAAGAVTPVGSPEGTATTATIGPAGGTIESADKQVIVQIPAGALATSQTISVQPISNNCPGGTGRAFRLTPHGITFTKPATITFQYSETDVNGSNPALLRIAYQNSKGIWQSPAVKSLDTTAHTVTVQTTHFSDWGLFKKMFIYPQNSFLNPGDNVYLRVFQTVEEVPVEEDDLIVPLPTLMPTKYIEKWALRGEGTLAHQHNDGTYYAPSRIPATNPAAVTVFLNKSTTIEGKLYKDLRLISNIFVAPEGISVQIDGGEWKTYPGGANINTTHNVILGQNGTEYASLGWKGAPTGTFRWTKSTDVAFNIVKGALIYQHLYGSAPSVSGGSLKVDNSDPTWVVGTFTVEPAGWIDTSPPGRMGTSSVKGVIRVKRVGVGAH